TNCATDLLGSDCRTAGQSDCGASNGPTVRRSGWLTGIEPATSGATVQRSNRLSYSHHAGSHSDAQEDKPLPPGRKHRTLAPMTRSQRAGMTLVIAVALTGAAQGQDAAPSVLPRTHGQDPPGRPAYQVI